MSTEASGDGNNLEQTVIDENAAQFVSPTTMKLESCNFCPQKYKKELSNLCIPEHPENNTIYKLNHWQRFPYHYDHYLYDSNATSFGNVSNAVTRKYEEQLEIRRNMAKHCQSSVIVLKQPFYIHL